MLSESTFPSSQLFLHHALLLDLAFKQFGGQVTTSVFLAGTGKTINCDSYINELLSGLEGDETSKSRIRDALLSSFNVTAS